MTNKPFWFSQKISRYYVKSNVVKFTDEEVTIDWDNCWVEIIGKKKGKTRIVLRSQSKAVSGFFGRLKKGEVRYMVGIDISSVYKPRIDKNYELNKDQIRKNMSKQNINRVVFSLDERYELWEEYKHTPIESTDIFKLYTQIKEYIHSTQDITDKDISEFFKIEIDESKIDSKRRREILPIIYQPAIDELRNYVIQVHVNDITQDVWEVSLVFENEELRRFSLFNKIYERIRLTLYGRIMDVETFRIYGDRDQKKVFSFENIYSKKNGIEYGIEYDTIHGDPPPNVPPRDVEYYFLQNGLEDRNRYKHPIVFINTSNHAMAEDDGNHEIWKWEYILYLKDSKKIEFNSKSRKEINDSFKSLARRICEIEPFIH